MRSTEAPRARDRQRGFTLIEVLVALAIIAIAMGAAIRATGVMIDNNLALLDKSLALLAAENVLAQLRLEQTVPQPGRDTVPCPEGGRNLRCERVFTNSVNGGFRQVTVRVHAVDRPEATLAQLTGLLSGML
ncbi:MAG TPA: type II secretion system minor pseudopilin GspI [Bordetella sp.]